MMNLSEGGGGPPLGSRAGCRSLQIEANLVAPWEFINARLDLFPKADRKSKIPWGLDYDLPAAGDAQHGPGHVGRRIGQEKQDRFGNLFGAAGASQRHRGRHSLEPAGHLDLGRDQSRRDRIDADVVGGKLAGALSRGLRSRARPDLAAARRRGNRPRARPRPA